MLYEDAGEMVEYLAQALRQTSREATILLYAPALDPHLQKLTELADRVFCIYSKQAAQREAKMPGAQRTLERWRPTHEMALVLKLDNLFLCRLYAASICNYR